MQHVSIACDCLHGKNRKGELRFVQVDDEVFKQLSAGSYAVDNMR